MENDDNDNDNDNDDNDDIKQCHPPEASTGAPYSKNQLNWSQNSWDTRGVYLENVKVPTPFNMKIPEIHHITDRIYTDCNWFPL